MFLISNIMKQIVKNFPTLRKAQNFLQGLYSRYNYVRLSDFPKFSENGEYVFTVDWFLDFVRISFRMKYDCLTQMD